VIGNLVERLLHRQRYFAGIHRGNGLVRVQVRGVEAIPTREVKDLDPVEGAEEVVEYVWFQAQFPPLTVFLPALFFPLPALRFTDVSSRDSLYVGERVSRFVEGGGPLLLPYFSKIQ